MRQKTIQVYLDQLVSLWSSLQKIEDFLEDYIHTSENAQTFNVLGITEEEKKKMKEACMKEILAEKNSLQSWMKSALAQYGEYKTGEMLQRTFCTEPGLLLTGFTEDSLLKIAREQLGKEKGGTKRSKDRPFSKEVWT